jgi:hypothetical protein
VVLVMAAPPVSCGTCYTHLQPATAPALVDVDPKSQLFRS